VKRFFGDATAARFCTDISAATPPPARHQVDRVTRADALMRGPLEAIEGLAPAVAAAERSEGSDAAVAAVEYRKVAATLEGHGYLGHALLMRMREVGALESAGNIDEAAMLLIALIEGMVRAGDASEAILVVNRLEQLVAKGRLAAGVRARADAALAMHAAVQHPFDDLTDLAGGP
jgi:hypothetical protein